MERQIRQELGVQAVFERVNRLLSPHEVLLEARKVGETLGIATETLPRGTCPDCTHGVHA